MTKSIEKMLLEGNMKFQWKLTQDIEKINLEGNIPKYPVLILTCMNPRIDVHRIFQLNPGDVFVLRNAGNICTMDAFRSIILAILEYNSNSFRSFRLWYDKNCFTRVKGKNSFKLFHS